MKQHFLKLPPNRVRRNYFGGAGIDWLHGNPDGADGNRPEEWIASLVPAVNPGMEPIADEGYARCMADGQEKRLIDLIKEAPDFYLGREYYTERGTDLGFLFKILDSSMRLHVQAHPTSAFAQEFLNSRYGKLECYYILHTRPGTKPYIRLGFQHAPSRAEWKRIIEEQDIAAMDACFEPIPVEEGQVWYIPGGMPHAIGENILMLEIMEPSDLVVRCEFEREGIIVPPQGRFMGKGLDFCMDIFDYTQYSPEEIRQKNCVSPKLLQEAGNYRLERLVGREITSSFEVQRLTLKNGSAVLPGGVPQILLLTRGSVRLNGPEETAELQRGDGLFAAAQISEFRVDCTGPEGAELCMVKPA